MKITKEQIAELDRKVGLPKERFTYVMKTVICEECGQTYEKEFAEPTWPHLIGRCPDCGAPIIQHSTTQEVENTCNCDSINEVRKLSDLTNEMIMVRKNFENGVSTETRCCSGPSGAYDMHYEKKHVVGITKTHFLDYVLEETSEEPNKVAINKGCLEECPEWKIVFNMDVTYSEEEKLCKHVIEENWYSEPDNDEDESCRVVRTLPRAVIVEVEAGRRDGYGQTAVCLDCILEVAKCPIVKKRE